MRKVALDLGAKKTCYCEVLEGQVVQRGTVTEVEALRSWLGPEQPVAEVVIEACREAWHVHDLLRSWGNEVVLVDTTRSRRLGIGQHGRKTDRIDAEVLAHALERGGIPVAHVLSPHRRELRPSQGMEGCGHREGSGCGYGRGTRGGAHRGTLTDPWRGRRVIRCLRLARHFADTADYFRHSSGLHGDHVRLICRSGTPERYQSCREQVTGAAGDIELAHLGILERVNAKLMPLTTNT